MTWEIASYDAIKAGHSKAWADAKRRNASVETPLEINEKKECIEENKKQNIDWDRVNENCEEVRHALAQIDRLGSKTESIPYTLPELQNTYLRQHKSILESSFALLQNHEITRRASYFTICRQAGLARSYGESDRTIRRNQETAILSDEIYKAFEFKEEHEKQRICQAFCISTSLKRQEFDAHRWDLLPILEAWHCPSKLCNPYAVDAGPFVDTNMIQIKKCARCSRD